MGRIWRKKCGSKVDAQSYYVELEKLTPLQELNIKSDPEHYGRKIVKEQRKEQKRVKNELGTISK